MGYLSTSFDPALVALNSDAASSALVEADAASSAAVAASLRASAASSAVAARSVTWDKASAASSATAVNASSIASLSSAINTKDNYASWSFAVDGVTKDAITSADVLDFVGGDNITITRSADDEITFSGTGGVSAHGDLTGLDVDDHSQYILADGTRSLTADWNIGNHKLGINTAPLYPLHIRDNPGDVNFYGTHIDIDPSGVLTATRGHYGLYINTNSTVNRNGNSYTVTGASIGTFSSGAADITEMVGLSLNTQHNVSTSLNIYYGLKSQGQFINCEVDSAYGIYSYTTYGASSSGTAYYGNYSRVLMGSPAGTLSTAYGYISNITQSAGTLTSGYLFAGFFSGTVGTKWGLYLSGEDKSYFSGNVGIGESSPTCPLCLTHWPGDESLTQVYTYMGPSDTHTAVRTIRGIYAQIMSTASDGGNTSNLTGVGSYVNSTGDMAEIYGAYFQAYYNNAATINIIAGSRTATTVNAGGVNNAYGNRSEIVIQSTAGATSAAGIRTRVYMNGSGVLSNAYGVQAFLQQNAGTFTTGYMFYGQYTGTIGTKWGLYLIGEDKSYFSGQVGIKEDNPSADLDVNGTLILASGVAINEFSTDTTLAGDSDDAVPTEKAVKTYVDAVGGVSDHGALTGLDDDDHTQYLLAAGTRELSGTWNYGAQTISGTGAIYTSGNVGIGTTTPSGKLHVAGSHIFTDMGYGFMSRDTEGELAGMYVSNIDDSLKLITNAIPRLTISEDGKVSLLSGTGINEFSTDTTLAGDSDDAVPTEKAVKTYVDGQAGSSYVKVSDVKNDGTNGGTFQSGAWRTRTLNTEDSDPDGICSLSSNQITLSAGTYECHISAPAYEVNEHKAALRNVTDSADVLIGTSEYSDNVNDITTRSFIVGRFTIEASKALEVRHRCATTNINDGFGIASHFGVSEVYTIAEFWKVG